MGIPLNSILNLSEEDIANSKIELNMDAGRGGESFMDRWLCYSEEEKVNGTCTECSYWGWYGNKRNFAVGQMVFSFIRLNKRDEWLLISVAKITNVPEVGRAEGSITDRFKPFFGRLIICLEKGQTFGRYAFWMSKYIHKAEVFEVLPTIYSGETFRGYDWVNLPYSKLKRIFNREILPTYHDALACVSGIYCLTDTKTGKLYIGSATGEGGVAQRWGNYLASGHGGNKELRALHEQKGDEYFSKYFTFTLLEHFSLHHDPDQIVRRESYWKDCLDTRKHGYNDN